MYDYINLNLYICACAQQNSGYTVWWNPTNFILLSYMDPCQKDNDYSSRRNMGFRPTGWSSLTGYVYNSRQSDLSSPVRYLQPLSETSSFRHPDHAQGRDSLTSFVGSLGSARVVGSYSATPSNLTNTRIYHSGGIGT